MSTILFGLIFLYVDLSFNGVSITPAFVGYILLLLATTEEPWRGVISRWKPFLYVFAVANALAWVAGCFGYFLPEIPLQLVTWAMENAAAFFLTRGMVELEGKTGYQMNTRRLFILWCVLAAVTLADSFLGLWGVLAGAVAAAAYIAALWTSWRAWRNRT